MAQFNDKMKRLLQGKSFALRKSVVFAFIAGLTLGVGGLLWFQWYNPKDEPVHDEGESISVIFGRIAERNEMVAASQDYTIVEKAVDNNKLFDLIEIPFTQNSFWYRYSGTIEATVDLSAATWEEKDEGVLAVSLPEPVLQNVPDMTISGVLEEHNNMLNPIHVEDVDEFQRQCIALSNQQAEQGGLKDEAKASAQANLQGMFDVACGKDEYTIEVIWLGADGGEQGE